MNINKIKLGEVREVISERAFTRSWYAMFCLLGDKASTKAYELKDNIRIDTQAFDTEFISFEVTNEPY